jgi:hypothetical protein
VDGIPSEVGVPDFDIFVYRPYTLMRD